MRFGEVGGVGLGFGLEVREVDDEDVCLARLEARHVEEVDVVLREGHHRRVPRRVEARLAHIRPRQRRAPGRRRGVGSGSDGGEVEEEELARGERVEDVGVVVEDGFVVGGVERGGTGRGRDGLLGPGLGAGVVDVDGGGVGGVGGERVDAIEELEEYGKGKVSKG